MLQIHKSMHPMNEFAPTWNIPLWFDKYENTADLNTMREWIIGNEQNIIATHKDKSKDDGGTGLGKESLTAQYKSFNLFKEAKDVSVFNTLFNWLQQSYINFMNEYKTQPRKCIMFCWANVLRKDKPIDIHCHGAKHFSYLSGNLHLEDYSTQTVYHNPVNPRMVYETKNVAGGLTLFPSYIFHQADTHKGEKERVSMAFDLFDTGFYEGDRTNGIEFNA